jgi:hypothetical protein
MRFSSICEPRNWSSRSTRHRSGQLIGHVAWEDRAWDRRRARAVEHLALIAIEAEWRRVGFRSVSGPVSLLAVAARGASGWGGWLLRAIWST